MENQTCATAGCGKPAKMRCPTCIKLDVTEGSFFCAQDCFKANWGVHKPVHKAAKQAKQMQGPLTFRGFSFTGPQRPYQQSAKRVVPDHIPRPDYADDPDGTPFSEMQARGKAINVLGKEEIDKLRVACKIGRAVLDEAGKMIKAGVTTDDIDKVVHDATVARNSYPSPLNYRGFPKSCCTSVNEVICHGIPDNYPLKDGDIVNVDVTVYHNGYHADLNETFFVGKVDDETSRLVRNAYDCLMAAMAACKPGTRYRDLGDIISKVAEAEKFAVVRTYCGHGINNLFHTAPNIPHYKKNKAPYSMKPGHVFTIEPMINAGVWQDEHWPDNWTAVTQDGKRSSQFEHTMVVTETGIEVLTARTEDSPSGSVWFETAMGEKAPLNCSSFNTAEAESVEKPE